MVRRLVIFDKRFSRRLAFWLEARPLLRRGAMALAHSGDSPIWLAVLLLTVWLGSAFWKYEAVLDLIGIAITASVVQIIKWRVQRPRPRGQWGQSYRRLDPHSFPSGHAARAIMLATVAIFLGPLWWTLALVIWAPLVGVARVGMRVHYISDVVAGGLCGLVCGLGLGISLTF